MLTNDRPPSAQPVPIPSPIAPQPSPLPAAQPVTQPFPYPAIQPAAQQLPQPVMQPTAQVAADLGPEDVRFTHSGRRFLLGYSAQTFGIWDRLAPGPPVQRFPRTDEGWAMAWSYFASWEPGLQTLSGDTSRQVMASEAPTNGLAVTSLVLAVLGMLILYVIGPILAIVFGYVSRNQIDASNGAQKGRDLAVAGIIVGWVSLVISILIVIGLVASRR